ncbi:tripartite tricarboxylate transporter substrate binding protein [Streptomyces calidiresistens]|uniref:Tripartite tricarboxylate transporter substrate binding protein n=1 Tax=Streptomyces calidiresistens TaxID=1485586 RepID=A0A7W3XUN5_9ACTN|nr:tripartite tricarboxylate transporter substrate binding protein [Streptomyces calidiresistens]
MAVASASALLLTACAGTGEAAAGDGWQPDKPIEYIAPANTGGGWDTLARTSARVLEENDVINRPMRVVNKPGGGGAIGWAHVAGKEGDPHTLFVTSPPILLVPLAGESDFDHTDFTPIARLAGEPLAYLVRADSPLTTFADLVEEVRDDPGSLSVAGGSGPGSMDHVGLAGAVQAGGADPSTVRYVPFDGGGEAMTALLGGHVQAAVSGASEARALVASGDLRVLAISGDERVGTLPDTETLGEQGIDYVFEIWRGVMGAPGMTEEQVAYYEDAFAEMTELDAWKQETEKLGWVHDFAGSAEFGEFLDGQYEELSGILTDIGLKK